MKNRRQASTRSLADKLKHINPVFHALHFDEPKLVFGGGELSVDPKAGLSDSGPYDLDQKPNQTIQIGVIGTGQGIGNFLEFLQKAGSEIDAGRNTRGKTVDPLAFPKFPGLSAETTFRADFVSNNSAHHRTIHQDLFANALKRGSDEGKIEGVVGLLLNELKAMSEIEPPPDVVVVVLPPEVEHETAHVGAALAKKRIRLSPRERFERKLSRESAKTGQAVLNLNFDDGLEDSTQQGSSFYNIHHAFKARAMAYGIPTQIVWDRTFRDPLLSSVAWNMFTAIYYKAGNVPWRLQSLPENTCFVGISFFKEKPYIGADTQSSLAQVFGAGEGIVLRGEKAVKDPTKGDRNHHLTEAGAIGLLTAAIERYTLQHGGAPTRVVVHKTSRYWEEELRGLKKALGEINHYDFLAVETLGSRFMRMGKHPVLRGTMITLADGHYVLFTNGYVPYLRSYPSKRIPRPIEVIEHHGDSTPQNVCQELLALTKLNWNSCWFASGIPITIRFSRDVGKIIAALPDDETVKLESKYRFFM